MKNRRQMACPPPLQKSGRIGKIQFEVIWIQLGKLRGRFFSFIFIRPLSKVILKKGPPWAKIGHSWQRCAYISWTPWWIGMLDGLFESPPHGDYSAVSFLFLRYSCEKLLEFEKNSRKFFRVHKNCYISWQPWRIDLCYGSFESPPGALHFLYRSFYSAAFW